MRPIYVSIKTYLDLMFQLKHNPVMGNEKLLSVSEVAEIMGISRTHVLRKIKSGELLAQKVGKTYTISSSHLPGIYQPLTKTGKKQIDRAVEETVKEYGEVIRKLGQT